MAGEERGPLPSTTSPRGEVPVVWREQGVCRVERGAAQDEWVWGAVARAPGEKWDGKREASEHSLRNSF